MDVAEVISTRERIILASMDEVRSYGAQGFSLRRVAAACGISCAAPYKHFADKQELFREMLFYINDKWHDRLIPLLSRNGSVADMITVAAVDYVRFLSENPPFRAMLTLKDMGLDSSATVAAAWPSTPIKRLFVRFAHDRRLGREDVRKVIFSVRSLVYGSSMIIGTDPQGDSERYLTMLKSAVRDALE